MTNAEQRAAAKAFAKKWQGRGYEKGESQSILTIPASSTGQYRLHTF